MYIHINVKRFRKKSILLYLIFKPEDIEILMLKNYVPILEKKPIQFTKKIKIDFKIYYTDIY
jgi:hypothetical protein